MISIVDPSVVVRCAAVSPPNRIHRSSDRLTMPRCLLVALAALCPSVTSVASDAIPDVTGGSAVREGRRVVVMPDAGATRVELPRMYARVRSVVWDDGTPVKLLSTARVWTLQSDRGGDGTRTIEITFDEEPRLAPEIEPVASTGDGGVLLHAFQGTTSGEKLLYEPQSHKNTIGYWTIVTDSVTWQFQIDQPGDFNVALLQGLGEGQGGSSAELVIESRSTDYQTTQSFEPRVTGHFQNFQWNQIGTVSLPSAGRYTLTVRPIEIAETALMDIRQVQLVKLPADR